MYKVWDHKAPSLGRDDTVDASLIGYEARWGFGGSQPSTEAGDFFFSLCHDVPLFEDALFRLSHVVGVLGSMVVDGGHESIGSGVDSGAEIVIFE